MYQKIKKLKKCTYMKTKSLARYENGSWTNLSNDWWRYSTSVLIIFSPLNFSVSSSLFIHRVPAIIFSFNISSGFSGTPRLQKYQKLDWEFNALLLIWWQIYVKIKTRLYSLRSRWLLKRSLPSRKCSIRPPINAKSLFMPITI